MNTKKILLTTGIFPPEVGGPATYSALLEKELPKYGIDVEVLPFRTVRHLPKIVRHFVFFCKVLVAGFDKNILYSQDPVSVGFPTMLASKILRKPFLVRVAGDYAWEQSVQRFGVKENIDEFQTKKYGFKIEFVRLIQKITTKTADRVITPSKYFKDLVGGWNPKVGNVVTIYNGIDFKEIPEKTQNHEPKTIISAGRLVPWKNFDFLIELMIHLSEWKLIIAGDGPDMGKLSKLIMDKHLENRVVLLGNVKRTDLIKKIQASELFILNTSFESFSFQVVEAMRAGTPVITTNVGNLSEIIDDDKEGFLVEPNNKEQIISVIEKLQDKNLRADIIKNAYQKSEIFSIENTLIKTSGVILDLINKK